jgi:phosphopantothenoylcysteine decarboxylase/phosphopantothenate--cysteine ligase
MASGLATDTITAACLATSVPVVVAPAMDGGMYTHPATQANVARLRQFGYRIVEPEEGELASGMTGRGRLAALPAIVDAVAGALSGAPARPAGTSARSDLAGRHVVVTAGGTAEPIDPVRYVGNRSTGKMGVAVAQEALDRGAAVTLILANASAEPPAGTHVARVETAAEMQAALQALTPPDGPTFDVLVMAAAVADFRPAAVADRKISRSDGLRLDLEPTPDLLAETAERVRVGVAASGEASPVLVGFAAETGSLKRAPEKLRAKGVDLLVANDVSEPGSGFGTDTNRVTIYAPDSPADELPLLPKSEVARQLLDRVVIRLDARRPRTPEASS